MSEFSSPINTHNVYYVKYIIHSAQVPPIHQRENVIGKPSRSSSNGSYRGLYSDGVNPVLTTRLRKSVAKYSSSASQSLIRHKKKL